MAEGAPSGKPGRASARLVARAEAALPLLLRALVGDPLRAIVQLLGDANLPCFRLACRAFRDHPSKPEKKCIECHFHFSNASVTFVTDASIYIYIQ
jgi:hypothetical protein